MIGVSPDVPWICCHLGAREHYVVPRALHAAGRLRALYTDAWAPPGSAASALGRLASRALRERFHAELADVPVREFTGAFLMHELKARAQRAEGWQGHMARNAWFQSKVTAALRDDGALAGEPGIVFAHSYSARAIFAEAKAKKWTTVLGQIDPGPEHFRILDALARESPEFGPAPQRPPEAYFDAWREECVLADWVVVNSNWSRTALEAAGVPAAKLRVMPLAYEPPTPIAAGRTRQYPASFSASRPLRALFVGTASVGKGVADVLRALELLPGQPIELRIVGDRGLTVPARLAGQPQVRWKGRINRHAIMSEYQECDVLLFPSHSDGFGMAQVEAHAWGLPIIASRHCGEVVIDGETGILLDEVSPQAIANALARVLTQPQALANFAAASTLTRRSGLSALTPVLTSLPRA